MQTDGVQFYTNLSDALTAALRKSQDFVQARPPSTHAYLYATPCGTCLAHRRARSMPTI